MAKRAAEGNRSSNCFGTPREDQNCGESSVSNERYVQSSVLGGAPRECTSRDTRDAKSFVKNCVGKPTTKARSGSRPVNQPKFGLLGGMSDHSGMKIDSDPPTPQPWGSPELNNPWLEGESTNRYYDSEDEQKQPILRIVERNFSQQSSLSTQSSKKKQSIKKSAKKAKKTQAVKNSILEENQKQQGDRDAKRQNLLERIDELEEQLDPHKMRRKAIERGEIVGLNLIVNPWEASNLKWVRLGDVHGDGDIYWQVQSHHYINDYWIYNGLAREPRRNECIFGSESFSGYKGIYFPVEMPRSIIGQTWHDHDLVREAVQLAVLEVTRLGKWDNKLLLNHSMAYIRKHVLPWPDAERDVMDVVMSEQTVVYRTTVLEQINQSRIRHNELSVASNLLKHKKVETSSLAYRDVMDGNLSRYVTGDMELNLTNKLVRAASFVVPTVMTVSWLLRVAFTKQTSIKQVSSEFFLLGAGVGTIYKLCSNYVDRSMMVAKCANEDGPSNITMRPLSALSLLAKCSGQREVKCVKGLTKPTNYDITCEDKPVEIYGCTIKDASIVTPLPCSHNQYNAFAIRMFFPRESKSSAVAEFMDWFRGNIIPKLFRNGFKMYSDEEALSRIRGPRLRAIKAAEPCCHLDKTSSTIDSFVKREVYVGKNPHNFKPRMINGRRVPFLKRVMTMMYSVCKSIESSFGLFDNVTIDSGYSATEVAELADSCSRFKHLVESDVSNWDGSLGPFFRQLELEIFEACPGYLEWLNELKLIWKETDIVGKHGFKAYMNWGRNSGEVVTSTFNSVFNLSLVLYLSQKLKARSKVVVKGDDNFFGITVWDEAKAHQIYNDLGIPKVEFVEREGLDDLEYCSGKFYQNEDATWKWGVKTWRQFSKFGCNFNHHPKKIHHRLMVGTALSMLPIAGHVPLFGEFVHHVSSLVSNPVKIDVESWKNTDVSIHRPSLRSKMLFCQKYGISLAGYHSIVKQLESLSLQDFPFIFDDPWVLKSFNRECGISLNEINQDSITFVERIKFKSSIFLSKPLLLNLSSAILEESLRTLFPIPTTLVLAGFEGYHLGPLNALAHCALHFLPISLRFSLHVLWNLIATLGENAKASLSALGLLLGEADNASAPCLELTKKTERIDYLTSWLWRRVTEVKAFFRKNQGYSPLCKIVWVLKNNRLTYISPEPCEQMVYHVPGRSLNNNTKKSNTKSNKVSKKTARAIASSVVQKMKPKSKKSSKNPGINLASALTSAISAGMKLGGGALGSMVGQPAVGGAAGAWLSKITGFGDYEISSNSLVKATGVPGFMKHDRKVIISHREFIGDISTVGNAFSVSNYNINPGNAVLFPWLSSVASMYQQYRFRGLIFEFCSASANALNSTNTALGRVIMATNYNVSRPNFASKLEMEQSEFCSSAKPAEDLIHPIECNPEETPLRHLYIRSGPVDGVQDLKFYDLANFQLATVGQQAASVIGELWVSYEIELLKPRLPGQIAGAAAIDWAYRNTPTFSSADAFNTGGLLTSGFGNIPVQWQNNTISFPPTISSGTFVISIVWSGASTSCVLTLPSVSSNAQLNTSYPGNGALYGPTSATAVVSCFANYFVRINSYSANGTTVTLSGITLPNTPNNMICWVLPAPTIPNASPY